MPKANYQGALEIAVARHIAQRAADDFMPLERPAPVHIPRGPVDLVLHPVPRLIDGGLLEPVSDIVRAAKRDYAAIEAANSALGLAGEMVVAEHVSGTRGDGLGCDVLSFDPDGRCRHIEGKTSRYGAATPFFVTDNEVRVSERDPETYWLYRLYDFRNHAGSADARSPACRLFGNLRENLDLRAVGYRALPA